MFKKSYNQIMAGFTKTIKALDDLEARESKNITGINAEMDSLHTQKMAASKEMKAASATATKLRELIGA